MKSSVINGDKRKDCSATLVSLVYPLMWAYTLFLHIAILL